MAEIMSIRHQTPNNLTEQNYNMTVLLSAWRENYMNDNFHFERSLFKT